MERGHCEDTLAACEDEPSKSEKETSSRLSEDVKIAVLMEKTRGQLQEHLRQNASALDTYQDVKDVIVNYRKTKQSFNKNPSKDPDAMEIGTVSKGKGK